MNKHDIAAACKAKAQDKRISYETSATQIGSMSAATFSNIVNGIGWDKISDAMWLRAANWCGYKAEATGYPLLETHNLGQIAALCNDAQENGTMLGIAGYTGAGKTTALAEYANTKGIGNVHYMLWDVTMGRKDFLNALLKAMGKEFDGSIYNKTEYIVQQLLSQHKPLIIIDTCGELNNAVYRLIQVLYDKLNGGAGIVLTGTDAFRKYINKMANKDKMGFRELRRRIEYWLPLRGIQANEIKAVCHHYGITDAEAVQYVQQVCDNYGSLKGMITAYDKAMRNTKPELIKTQREMLYHLRFGHTQDDAPAKGKGLKAA